MYEQMFEVITDSETYSGSNHCNAVESLVVEYSTLTVTALPLEIDLGKGINKGDPMTR